MLFICGIPLFMAELALGQYSGQVSFEGQIDQFHTKSVFSISDLMILRAHLLFGNASRSPRGLATAWWLFHFWWWFTTTWWLHIPFTISSLASQRFYPGQNAMPGGTGKGKNSPNVGLEPTTVGLRVQRSTDWASRAENGFLYLIHVQIFIIIKVRPLERNASSKTRVNWPRINSIVVYRRLRMDLSSSGKKILLL